MTTTAPLFQNNKEQTAKIKKEEFEPENVFVLRNVLSEEECKFLIKLSEDAGFEPVPETGGRNLSWSGVSANEVRNNLKVTIENEETKKLANAIWKRIEKHIEQDLQYRYRVFQQLALDFLSSTTKGAEWKNPSVSERFRFYKYEKNQHFLRHFDGTYKRTVTQKGDSKSYVEQSFVSIICYLNDDFQGGETKFFDSFKKQKTDLVNVEKFTYVPKRGDILCFLHENLHEGCDVIKGRKYVLRSDICYVKEATQAAATSSTDTWLQEATNNKKKSQAGEAVITKSKWERIYHPSCKDYTD